jgi:hypothetical protein
VPFAQRESSGNKELAETIKNISKLQFGRDREIVEAEIRDKAKFQKEVSESKPAAGASPFGGFGGF